MDSQRLHLLESALHCLLETLHPTQQADEDRRAVLADMQQLVAKALPPELHCSVETFGSFRAGLHLPGSDLDFALAGWLEGPEQQQIELHECNSLEQQYLLSDLADALEEHQLVQGTVERVLHARVPVIKFTHRTTGVACDFSINRPECTFKCLMQALLGSLDRRYAALYRLVKAWAAAHGVNDAAANTLNSWSLGLMVAFYLQCGTSPAILPPIWQLLEREAPDVRQPRVLQLPNVNSALLKRMLTKALTGAGAYAARKAMAGADALNGMSVGELFAGFFQFYAPCLDDWCEGRTSNWRASTWWGEWKEAAWYPAKSYIYSIEDPFNAGDNTARAVGTRNQLSSCQTAAYIAATFAASDQQLQQALQDSSSSDVAAAQGDVLTAFAWLFGPHAVLQLRARLPQPLVLQLEHHIPAALCEQLQQQLDELEQDCMQLLSYSSSLVNRHNSSIAADPDRVELVLRALAAFKQLLQVLGCSRHHVCLGDFLEQRRQQERQQAEQREIERQARRQQQDDWKRQKLQQQQLEGQRQTSLQQVPDAVAAAMQGLQLSSSPHKLPQHHEQQGGAPCQRIRAPAARRQARQSQQPDAVAVDVMPQQHQGRGRPHGSHGLFVSVGQLPGASTSNSSSSGGQKQQQPLSQSPPPMHVRQWRQPQQQVNMQQHQKEQRRQSDGSHQHAAVATEAAGQGGCSNGSRTEHSNSDSRRAPASAAVGGSRLAASAVSGLVAGKGRQQARNGYCTTSSSREGHWKHVAPYVEQAHEPQQ